MRRSGFEDVRILRCDKEDGTPGGPAVVARRPAAEGKPTILLYAHHDVQPTGDPALWETEPFTAVERDGRLYGRGAADDKAGIMAHIAAYAAVTRVLGDDLGLGVTFFFEGEEEAGSPTFRTFLETHRELLRADVIVVADSSNWKVGVPALTTSLRGLVDGTIEVQVLDHAVHSGMFGGPVLDAPTLLSRLIATLHDDEGNVAIAGLVSGTTPPWTSPKRNTGPMPRCSTASGWPAPARSPRGCGPSRPCRSSASTLPPWTWPRTRSCPGRGPSSACGSRPGRIPAEAMEAVRQACGGQCAVRREGGLHAGGERQCVPHGHLLQAAGARDVGAGGGLGRAGGGNRHRRFHSVHRRPDRAVPGRADPGHRRRGSRFPGAQCQRIPASWGLPERDRGEALLLARSE